MKVLEKVTIHIILNSTQQFQKDTGLQPLTPLHLRVSSNRSSGKSQQQQGSRFKSSRFNIAGRDSWRDLAILVVERRHQVEHLVILEPRPLARDIVAKFSFFYLLN